ncbi:MAG: metallophosphoesterase [Acidobacteria bacterium]|nr:metallophosphoesterase [Acidobacteriota bacterium]
MPIRKRLTRWRIILLILFTLLAGLLVYAYEVEPYRIEVTRYHLAATLQSPIKIAHLTDLHTYGLGRREGQMIAILKAEKPDLIVITGDQISDLSGYDGCRQVLQQLHAPLGVWVVPGNHDNWYRIAKQKEFYAEAGAKFLKNESGKVRDDVWIIGLDDAMTGTPDIKAALKGVPENAYKIGLFHAPAYFDVAAGKCDVVFAGHTHGGQIRVPFLKPFWLPKACGDYVAGWYERAGSKLYVSRGIGTSIVSVRFNCRPEIAIITLD